MRIKMTTYVLLDGTVQVNVYHLKGIFTNRQKVMEIVKEKGYSVWLDNDGNIRTTGDFKIIPLDTDKYYDNLAQ